MKEQNECIMNVYNEYKIVYDDKYSESFKDSISLILLEVYNCNQIV